MAKAVPDGQRGMAPRRTAPAAGGAGPDGSSSPSHWASTRTSVAHGGGRPAMRRPRSRRKTRHGALHTQEARMSTTGWPMSARCSTSRRNGAEVHAARRCRRTSHTDRLVRPMMADLRPSCSGRCPPWPSAGSSRTARPSCGNLLRPALLAPTAGHGLLRSDRRSPHRADADVLTVRGARRVHSQGAVVSVELERLRRQTTPWERIAHGSVTATPTPSPGATAGCSSS